MARPPRDLYASHPFPDDQLVILDRAAIMMKQIADRSRIQIMAMLEAGEVRTVGEMIPILKITQASISHHITMLRHAGLVTGRYEGHNVIYRLTQGGRVMMGVIRAAVEEVEEE
jgi:DNA-binding transcriptional ArsR family regulator